LFAYKVKTKVKTKFFPVKKGRRRKGGTRAQGGGKEAGTVGTVGSY